MVGAAQSMPGLANTVQLEATSPCSASLVLAKHFWPETSKAVVAKKVTTTQHLGVKICEDYNSDVGSCAGSHMAMEPP